MANRKFLASPRKSMLRETHHNTLHYFVRAHARKEVYAVVEVVRDVVLSQKMQSKDTGLDPKPRQSSH
eukprot:4402715-Pyramimonas_sp.AAC.1